MIKRTILCLIIGVGFMASACGDDLGDKPFNELTEDESFEVCEDVRTTTFRSLDKSVQKVTCVNDGVTISQSNPNVTCEEVRDACLAEPADDQYSGADCADAVLADCDATVDEVKSCLDAQADQLASFTSEYDCGNLSVEFPTTLPSACDALAEKCPGQFDEQ